jgi:hypothetical protein
MEQEKTEGERKREKMIPSRGRMNVFLWNTLKPPSSVCFFIYSILISKGNYLQRHVSRNFSSYKHRALIKHAYENTRISLTWLIKSAKPVMFFVVTDTFQRPQKLNI